MLLTKDASIYTLTKEYPFLIDALANHNKSFEKLKNPLLRQTVGRVASVEKAAGMGDESVLSLLLFIAGSVVAAMATDVQTVVIGRVLQGAGAISAAVTALAADLTRDQHRTKVMAMIGSSIGLVFAVSMVAAPLLYAAIGMSGLFWLTAALAVAAVFTVIFVVPAAPPVPRATGRFAEVLGNGQLMRLNFGVFALHLMQTAMWVLVPAGLVAAGLPMPEHWKVYLPAVLLSFTVMVPAVIMAEKKGAMKKVFNAAIGLLLLVQAGLYATGSSGLWPLAVLLTLFFVAFNVLEATQPSWISKIAPPHAKGTALGIYNTLQSIGLFLGGALGGWLAQHMGPGSVSLLCAGLALAWLILAAGMMLGKSWQVMLAIGHEASLVFVAVCAVVIAGLYLRHRRQRAAARRVTE